MPPRSSISMFFLMLALLLSVPVLAGQFGAVFLRTVCQPFPDSPLQPINGQIAIDDTGCIYVGSGGNGLGNFLHKISPDGVLIWQTPQPECHSPYAGVAVDDKYVYSCGISFYGYRHLLRRVRSDGALDRNWYVIWKGEKDTVYGLRAFNDPVAIKVDQTFLYILDGATGEVRRINKTTRQEVVFAAPIAVNGARDLAFSRTGTLLVLTGDALYEFDRQTGRKLQNPVMHDLQGAMAVAVHPATGAIYIGEGGNEQRRINTVSLFTANGQPAGVTFGHGGDFTGPIADDALCFYPGGHLAVDKSGGFWTNATGHRLYTLPLLTHFTHQGTPDIRLCGFIGDGIAVDAQLNCYVGSFKFSPSGNLLWAVSLTPKTAGTDYPEPDAPFMRFTTVSVNKDAAILVGTGWGYRVDVKTGKQIGARFAVPNLIGWSSIADRLYFCASTGAVSSLTATMKEPSVSFTAPKSAQPYVSAVVGDDDHYYFVAGQGNNARLLAYNRQGTVRWNSTGVQRVWLAYRSVILGTVDGQRGVMVVDARTGTTVGSFGTKRSVDCPPICDVKGMYVLSKDGTDYLVINHSNQLAIYVISALENGEEG